MKENNVYDIPEDFNSDESLLRAVFPPNKRPNFWRNGKLSSAALKDKNGLSVDRTYNRTMDEAVEYIRQTKQGCIFSIGVNDCKVVEALIIYCPTQNPFHSEIHGSAESVILSDLQAKSLAEVARMEYDNCCEIITQIS